MIKKRFRKKTEHFPIESEDLLQRSTEFIETSLEETGMGRKLIVARSENLLNLEKYQK